MKPRWKMLSAVVIAFRLTSTPVLAQGADEDDEPISRGELAAILLVGSGAVSEPGLKLQIRQALDKRKIRYSNTQLQSLARQSAMRLKSKRGGAGRFKVCAGPKGPCVKIVRQ